jgi:hypothetical protein
MKLDARPTDDCPFQELPNSAGGLPIDLQPRRMSNEREINRHEPEYSLTVLAIMEINDRVDVANG